MEIIGREIEFGVATEATRGTAEAAADKWLRKATANVVERAVHAVDDTTRGVFEDSEGRRVVQTFVEGDVDGIVHVDMLGWLLGNVYGICNTALVSGSVNDHVFTLQQSVQHISLSLFMKDGAVQQHVFNNCMIGALTIRATLDDFVRYNVSFIGASAATDTDTPSYDTEYDFIARDIVVKVAATEAGLTGATAVKVKDVEWTYDKGLIRDHVVGSKTPDDVYNSRMAIEGSFTQNFVDEVFKDYYLGDTAVYMSITLTGEADLGGATYPTLTLILNKVQFMDWNRAGGADELVTEPISFKGFYNTTDQEQSQTTLRNLTAAYTNVPTS